MKSKTKRVVHYDNLTPDVLDAIRKKYPLGYSNHVFKVTTPNNNFFYAITVDTEETSYLVKVKVKLDKADKLDEELFSNSDEKASIESDDIDSEADTDSEEISKEQ